MKKMLISVFLVVTLISTSVPALAGDSASVSAAMVADVIIARPVGLVAIVAGTAVFILALPFALLSSSVEPVAKALVADPFEFTFTRPVGDFSGWD